jgi:hypothetical protein
MQRTTMILALAATAAAQTVVVGTGDPRVDIPAVQSAVDRAGSILLQGRFSFRGTPLMRGRLVELTATVLVSKTVNISGTWDERGEMTTIEGGEIPFAVEAPGSQIRIERLRFANPKGYAILATAAAGITVESCVIEGVQVLSRRDSPAGMEYGIGIYFASLLGLPDRDRPGEPANFSGRISIVDNRVAMGGSPAAASEDSMGIVMAVIGTPEKPVDVDISGNTIRNATKKGINLKQIGGRVRIERNVVTSNIVYTGHSPKALIAGIHCGGTGIYRIAHNRIDYADPDAAGIRLRAMPEMNAMVEGAIVTDNDVTMSVPEGLTFGNASAGIIIQGLARNTVVERNRIQGRARIALSAEEDKGGTPEGTAFRQNDSTHLMAPAPNRER